MRPDPREVIATTLVDEAVLSRPKTLAGDATVADVRTLLGDHVHAALLVDGERLVGVVVRDDLDDVADEVAARSVARLEGRTVRSGTPLADSQDLLAASGQRRLAVVDGAGRLVGLLCRKRRSDGFCTDAGVEARRRERAHEARADAP